MEAGTEVAAEPVARGAGAESAAAQRGPWRRFLDRFLPAAERSDALWIASAAVVLGGLRTFVYPSLQRYMEARVSSPGIEELGFALRATAIADVVWGFAVGLLVWAVLMRFTQAPRAMALYLVLSGVLLALVSLGNRLALNAVMELAGSQYRRAIWSDLQPIMLASAQAVGVLLGAWLAQLGTPAERPADGSTLLPALGWSGRPAKGAARLAIDYIAAQVVAQLAMVVIGFGPSAYVVWLVARFGDVDFASRLSLFVSTAAAVVVLFLIGYLGVRRFGAPASIWLPFTAAGVPVLVNALAFLPTQLAAAKLSGVGPVLVGSLTLVSWPIGIVLPLLGVWFVTRPARMSVPSATLPAENQNRR